MDPPGPPEGPDQQTILEEEIDENYNPTIQEIHEYAQWLGMDVEVEKELLWIAREGLKAPLPKDWKPWCVSGEVATIQIPHLGSWRSV
mmetsp:Transcript_8837/g.15304  ORF Transcript_8837/g.15304 Transcript_8837/m.15304 type:complete len:88 (-) Transcript_8837:109-372(-)